MQIDIDYLKMILDKFVESETQYIETFTSYYHIMQLFVLYGTPSNQHLQ